MRRKYCTEHDALVGPIRHLCNVANWVLDGGGSPTDCKVVPVFLALSETGPDYEAAFDHYLSATGSCRQRAMEGAVDAALADYLTEGE